MNLIVSYKSALPYLEAGLAQIGEAASGCGFSCTTKSRAWAVGTTLVNAGLTCLSASHFAGANGSPDLGALREATDGALGLFLKEAQRCSAFPHRSLAVFEERRRALQSALAELIQRILHEDFDEAITADNIVARLRLGHILSVDDIDCWYERGPDADRLYYDGAPRPPAELRAVAEEIEARFAAAEGQLRVEWRLSTP